MTSKTFSQILNEKMLEQSNLFHSNSELNFDPLNSWKQENFWQQVFTVNNISPYKVSSTSHQGFKQYSTQRIKENKTDNSENNCNSNNYEAHKHNKKESDPIFYKLGRLNKNNATENAISFFKEFGYIIPQICSKEEIKQYYRKLCIKFHPDTSDVNNVELFIQLKECYSILDNNWHAISTKDM